MQPEDEDKDEEEEEEIEPACLGAVNTETDVWGEGGWNSG